MYFIIVDALNKNHLEVESEIIDILNNTIEDVLVYSEVGIEDNVLGESYEAFGVEYVGPVWGVKVKNANYDTIMRIKEIMSVKYEVDGIQIEAIASNFYTYEREKPETWSIWYVEVLPI